MSLLYRMGTGNGSGGDLKPFIVNFTCHSGFIGKTVTMEFQGTPHAGETVDNVSGTVILDSTDGKGKLTLYPMHDGLWKYYATSDLSGYQEGTITLEKWGNYPVELVDTPNGATVTPTDDVQTWLHCADIWDKTDLTTIDDVIADTATLNILISNNNASDYMARSTTWASDVCNNESAMTYIGLNDYCANKLLADNTWFTAICDSPHFKKVLNVKVPALDKDSSLVFSSTDYSSTHAKWKAFNGNNVTEGWLPADGDTDTYVGYEFTNPIIINKVVYFLYRSATFMTFTGKTINVKATNDNSKPISEWQELFTISGDVITDTEYDKKINNNTAYKYYAFNHNNGNNGGGWHIQFYGREEV